MDSNSNFARPLDESLARELPQLQGLRIAPLQHPVSSRGSSVPSPLEPNASVVRETKTRSSGDSGPTNLPPVTELPNTSSTVTTTSVSGSASQAKKNDDSLLDLEPPPKPILPAFVNPRALERFPYSSFDEDAHISRKRRRLDLHAELFGDHLQLPIPQQQKEHRPPPFGPFAILNGLNEPPPNAALLPPIEAGSISQLLSKPSNEDSVVEPALLTTSNSHSTESHMGERKEARIEELLGSPIDDKVEDNYHGGVRDAAANEYRFSRAESGQINYAGTTRISGSPIEKSPEPLSPKTRGRSRKNLRKWTEEETTDLLRGVIKCGIGNWKAILAQPELEFNKRSAANLKDRFRVCCPWAYRAADSNEATKRLHDTLASALQRSEVGSGSTTEKTLLPHPQSRDSASVSNVNQDTPSRPPKEPIPNGGSLTGKDIGLMAQRTQPRPPSPTGKPPRLSNKSKSALASLGIPEPQYVDKPRKRSRRPFTSSEDEALLKGYAVHGFQWTSIQQDERLNLGHRKATDLRDRFRTKFPHAYREGGSVSGKSLNTQNENIPSLSTASDTEKASNTAKQNVLH